MKRKEECGDGSNANASNDDPPSLTDSETDEEDEEEDSDDDTVPYLIEAEGEDDYDSDDDSLPDLVSASEDEEDYEDEGIADCDTFISMDSLIVLLGRYGLNNQQD